MSVTRLITHSFRNLCSASVDLHGELNFIIGENGSGKSSVLEALFFIGHGKSFRTSRVDDIVCHDNKDFVVSIKDENNRQFGLSRDVSKGTTLIKIDGERHNRLSDLAQHIAIQIVTPESFKLFFGGPKERRRFVDLGMFHVKHSFPQQWKKFSRILKQRNACLKVCNNSSDWNSVFRYWTEQFCKSSVEVAEIRQEYVANLTIELDLWLAILLPNIESRVRVQYLQGWPLTSNLDDALANNKSREMNYGHSLYGAHKFDVKFLLDKRPIETQLSRGQQKLFLLALTFAQAKLIERVERVKPIVLIDDVGAELDNKSRSALSKALSSIKCQVVITAIERSVISPFLQQLSCEGDYDDVNDIPGKLVQQPVEYYKMFHVEHGEISEIYLNDSECKIQKV